MVQYDSRYRLVTALGLLLDDSHQRRSFSTWEERCLSEALALARFSRFGRALQRLADMKGPPEGDVPPVGRRVTLDDVRQTIMHISKGHESLTGVAAFLATVGSGQRSPELPVDAKVLRLRRA